MANNFETLKTQASTEKFNLIRLEPGRYISEDLALVTTHIYSMTFAFKFISRIKVNTLTYTRVQSSPSSGEYTFDEETRLMVINLGAPLSSQVVVVFYYLFFTKDKARVTFEDPMDLNSDSRVWLPRIATDPSFRINLKEITNGYLSFGNSSLVLHNEDSNFEQYLTDNDSFSNKNVLIWLCLDNVANVKLVFKGLINRITINNKVTIEFFDEFSNLSKTFYSNGSYLSSTYNSNSFVNIHPAKENLPIRKIFAPLTYYKVIDYGVASGLYQVDPIYLLEGVCVGYNATISNTNNREWGSVLNGGDHGVQSDSVISADHSDPDFSLIGFGTTKKYKIGDTLLINALYSVRVLYVDILTHLMKTTRDNNIAPGHVIVRSGLSCIVITQDNNHYYLLYGRDYSVSNSSNPNDIIKIVLANNFEANFPGMLELSPDSHQLRFRAWTDTAQLYNHGTVLEEILNEVGLSVNSASIASANATFLETNFYIPFIDTTDFTQFNDYIEAILKSTFGFLSLNNDLEIEYKLFESLSPMESLNSRQIILDSFSTRLEYNDIKNTIQPHNSHDIIEIGYTNSGLENAKATYLHEIKSGRVYNHVLASTTKMQTILNVLSNRLAYYSFMTKTNPDIKIGDQFSLLRENNFIGSETFKNIQIINIDKKSNETTMEGIDLLGL